MDFLIPEATREAWHSLLLEQGYVLFHSSGAFSQYESASSASGLPPLDLMAVDVGTWEKLFAAAETERFADGYLAHWPAPLHLVALKLHAWRGVFREEKEQDWSDVLGVIQQCGIDIHGESFREIALRYGGPEALVRFGLAPPAEPEPHR
ncbi:MAG TPA: hypothetical protein PLA50_01680 [Bacteroidia bacterium]|nr:hypothetical protein [Bacteroidia bacterium]